MDYSKRLTDIRESKGMSQYKLSKLSGIPQATISRWESITFNPTLEMFNKLCQALNISVPEFFSDTESETKDRFDALHRLVDEVPEERRGEVKRFLEFTIEQHKKKEG